MAKQKDTPRPPVSPKRPVREDLGAQQPDVGKGQRTDNIKPKR